MRFYHIYLLSIIVTIVPGLALAGDREPFFNSNTARDVLPEQVLVSDIPGLEFFLPQRKETDIFKLEEDLPVETGVPSEPAQEKPQVAANEDQLIAKYGVPDSDEPILAIKDAPKPFQAMMEAKAGGFDDLAFRYAKQYARLLRNTKDRNVYVTGLIGKAMQREGILPDDAWPNTPQFDEADRLAQRDADREKLMEQELSESEQAEVDQIASLDDESKELLRRALKEEGRLEGEEEPGSPQKKDQPLDQNAERMRLAKLVAGRAPRDPKGKVDVFFFFRPQDQEALNKLADLQRLQDAYALDPNFNLVAFSMEVTAPERFQELRFYNRFTFPIRNGSDIALKLKLTKSPSVVFTAATTGETLIESKEVSFIFMDEAVKAIKGARK